MQIAQNKNFNYLRKFNKNGLIVDFLFKFSFDCFEIQIESFLLVLYLLIVYIQDSS